MKKKWKCCTHSMVLAVLYVAYAWSVLLYMYRGVLYVYSLPCTAHSKSFFAPLPALISVRFKTLAMASSNFTATMPTRLTGALRPVHGRKTN
jgi:hypothetical protein